MKFFNQIVCKSGIAAVLCSALFVTACASPTPYQPLAKNSKVSGGYSDQRLTSNRYRVFFKGNNFTSRQQVENYLLLRAAQLTVQSGYESFALANEAVDPKTRTTVNPQPFGAGPWGYWGPTWRYSYGGLGWRTWNPWDGSPFWADQLNIDTSTSYEASADILMYKGTQTDNPAVFNAREVIGSLENTSSPS